MAKRHSNINPGYKLSRQKDYSLEECKKALSQGRYDVMAYLISKAESKLEKDQAFIRRLLLETETKKSTRKIAISGAPGVGKSTFIDSFGSYLVDRGNTIAVLPVDPSSQISKGSILGDKTRMERLSSSDKAFIKPMSSSMSLGGLAPSTAVASMICERSVFDYILFETVGVGQSEVEARNICDMFILLLQPGGGDELQGIKRGIMEMADLFVITKADGSLQDDADNTARHIRQANSLLLVNSFGWKPGVIKHSSLKGEGNDSALEKIEDYFEFMFENGKLEQLRSKQAMQLFLKQSREMIMQFVMKENKLARDFNSIKNQLADGQMMVIEALEKLQDSLDASS